VSLNKHKMAIGEYSHYLLCILSWVSVYCRTRNCSVLGNGKKLVRFTCTRQRGIGCCRLSQRYGVIYCYLFTAGCCVGCLSCVANDCRVVDVCSDRCVNQV
jgi:hypothetical protein